MKKVLMLLLITVATIGCGEDKLTVIHNNDRVSELERRMDLNDALDRNRDTLIALNSELLQILAFDFEQRINDLTSDLAVLEQVVNDLIYLINNLPSGTTSVSTSGNILNIGGSCVQVLTTTHGNSSTVNGVTLQPVACP
jgi:hypothetical protein